MAVELLEVLLVPVVGAVALVDGGELLAVDAAAGKAMGAARVALAVVG